MRSGARESCLDETVERERGRETVTKMGYFTDKKPLTPFSDRLDLFSCSTESLIIILSA